MKSWIRSGLLTMLFLLIMLSLIFVFYREYLYDLLFEDYALFDDQFVYEKVDTYKLNFENNEFINEPIDALYEVYITILEKNNLSFTDYMNQSDGKKNKLYDVYFYDKAKTIFDNGVFLRQENGELSLKGKNPFNDTQKSFKIRLFDNEGLWKDQNVINLEKQEADPLRIRNKLALDLQEDIDQLFSLKSSFVRLFVKDLHNDQDNFYDYGLYVQVENVDDLYFLNRDISPNGYLYEVDDFRFQNEKLGELEDKDDINTKGDKGNKKFNNLVASINNPEIPTSVIVEQYFEKEHLLNWLAYNILIGNKNVVERDYYLYSPQISEKWYFIPDDSDASFGRIKNAPDWKLGIGNYYNNALYSRILLDDTMREALILKVDELSQVITEEHVMDKLNTYYDEFFNNITNEPDFGMLEFSFDEFRTKYFELAKYPDLMLINFRESLNYPLPFKVTSEVNDQSVIFSNFESQMLDGTEVDYIVTMSEDKDQNNVIKQYSTTDSYYVIDGLDKGVYYISVEAWNTGGYAQSMSNTYEDEFGKKKHGIIRIEIE